ncbi:hybrid sensor histidine kinase/response regulator transcription factor [Gaoshiqia sp. Z1-71]|uniref:hybrid sensor histidine kinase/response regulator transcription factor n=1 Tax=Gaoshiqia hydrogeniformans TaxID=3290090 RepID=UPI003BF8E4F9
MLSWRCKKYGLIVLILFPLWLPAIEIERFELLNTRDGLSQNSVQSIFCDSRGFMWFGTMDGLNQYDGYEFKVYKTNYNDPNSLTNNRIVKIWEDKRGFLWLESHDGHYHYLDLRTERFYSFPSNTDPANGGNTRISSFLELEDEIWIGTNGAGVYRLTTPATEDGIYSVERLNKSTVPALTNDSVSFILSDRDQGIWIGTSAGLTCLEPAGENNSRKTSRSYLDEYAFTGGVLAEHMLFLGTVKRGVQQLDLRNFHTEKLLIDRLADEISVLNLTKSGNLAIGTKTAGLHIYNPANGQQKRFLQGQSIDEIVEDRKGVLWISTSSFGITRIGPELERAGFYELVPREIQSLVDMQRQFIFEDKDSNIWVATHGGGVALFDESSMAFRFFRNSPQDRNSLSSDIAYCVAQDHSGLIWIGTGQFNGGVNKVILANPMFRQLKPERQINNLSDNVIRAIAQDSRNNIWMASKSGRLYVYDEDFRLISQFSGIPASREIWPRFNVYTILEDRDGFIWLGSKGGGLARSVKPLQHYLSYNDISFRVYRHRPGDSRSLANDNVYAVFQDRAGLIWVGTYGGGINLIINPKDDQLVFRRIGTQNNHLSSDFVRQITQDSNGTLWVATTFGLNRLSGDPDTDVIVFQPYFYDVNEKNSLSYNDIVHIQPDSDGRLWIGTFGGGLNRLLLTDAEAGFQVINHHDGLISDAVFGILEDDERNIWLSTENGISRLNARDGSLSNFDDNNGLQCSNFSENTCWKLRDGRLLFGTLDGLLAVTLHEEKPAMFKPPVVFTRLSIFNREVSFGEKNSPLKKHINFTDEIVLNYNQSGFRIEYAALSFFDPEKNTYEYTLEGFDKDWYQVRNERKATYTNVPPGKYIFHVRAANWDGTRTETPRSLAITILPPWWRTKQAYAIYFILLILFAEVNRRVLTRYNRMRTDLRVERKVNEIKLRFFTNISHEIRTPLTLVLGPLEDLRQIKNLPEPVKDTMERMSSNGKRMLRLVNQLLDFRKIQNQKMKMRLCELEIGPFVRGICQSFEQMARQRDICFRYPEDQETPKLLFDREKIDSVLFNLLSNAFKFTPKGKKIAVRIEVLEQQKMVSIVVEDEGKGIAAEKIPLLFQRFSPLSDEQTEFSGTGIGLAYSYELVKLHHGDVEVQSQPGEGSLFRVNLRMGKEHFTKDELDGIQAEEAMNTLPAENELDLQDSTAEDTDALSGNYKILLVEDNPDIRTYINSILRESYQVFQANDGEEGLDLARKLHPDLIVTDLMMPVMDGLTMTRIIKNDFSLSHIPIVMLTAKSAMDDQIEGIESGAEAYVIKPFHAGYLSRVIQNLLRQRQNVLDWFNKSNPFKGDLKITNKDEEFLKKVVSLIEKNCQDTDFNVDALVKESALGRTVFYNKIKTLTGMSPVEFLRNTKLQIAVQYLTDGSYSVSEAAYLSGFNDLKYFSKKFKERYHCPPSKYKEEISPV